MMADDSLSKVLAHLQSAARAAGKTIDPTPLTEGEKHALLAKLEQEARASSAAIQQAAAAAAARQASSTSPPPTNPQHPGRVYLVDTWPHRQAIKASGQAGYDTMARGWYLLGPFIRTTYASGLHAGLSYSVGCFFAYSFSVSLHITLGSTFRYS